MQTGANTLWFMAGLLYEYEKKNVQHELNSYTLFMHSIKAGGKKTLSSKLQLNA